MANILPVGHWLARNSHRVKWTGIASGDVALGASEVNLTYKTVNVTGVFDDRVITIQGSNATDRATATDWATLHDNNGSDLTFTSGAGRFETIAENPRWIRPTHSNATGGAGGGTMAIDVIMVSSRS